MKADRVLSLDAFRGLAIILMLLANNQGDESHVFAQLAHTGWLGCTFTDLPIPFFLFIMGAVVPQSAASRSKREEPDRLLTVACLSCSS